MLILVPGQLIASLFFALWLYRLDKKTISVSRIFLYLPTLSAGIIIAQSWKYLFHINGPINWIVGDKINWFGQGFTAIPIISFIVIFSSFGANVIILLASLQSVNKDYIEAATIDGCNYRQIKLHVLLPLIMPTILMIGILSAINSVMIFETIYSLCQQDYAATMAYQIYTQGFKFSQYGMASAQSIILLLFTVGLSILKRKVEK
jgi:multiple sugar transport system permease protein